MGSTRSVWATLGLPPFMVCVLSRSTLLRLQVALQENCLRWALGCMHFPGLSHSGSGPRVLHKGTDSVGPPFCALPRSEQLRRPGACRVHTPQVGGASSSPPQSQTLGFPGAPQEHCLRCAVSLLRGADLWLWPFWQMSTVQDHRKTWLATGSLLRVWYKMLFLTSSLPLSLQFWLSPAGLLASSGGWACPLLASSLLLFTQSFVLLVGWQYLQSVRLISRVQLFATPLIAALQASLSITNSWSMPKLISIESVMPSNHLILYRPVLLLSPIPPSIRVFSNK